MPNFHTCRQVPLALLLTADLALALGWTYARPDRTPVARELHILPLTSDPGDEAMPSLSERLVQQARLDRCVEEILVSRLPAPEHLQLVHSRTQFC